MRTNVSGWREWYLNTKCLWKTDAFVWHQEIWVGWKFDYTENQSQCPLLNDILQCGSNDIFRHQLTDKASFDWFYLSGSWFLSGLFFSGCCCCCQNSNHVASAWVDSPPVPWLQPAGLGLGEPKQTHSYEESVWIMCLIKVEKLPLRFIF